MIRLVLALLILPVSALADYHQQDRFPALSHVVNVNSDDALNIRLEPNPLSEIIGTLPYNATNVEIVGMDQSERWGLVNSNDGSGWVRLSFIEIPEQPTWHQFETPLTCFGTEPFWDFDLNASVTEAVYTDFDDAASTYSVDWISDIAARLGGTIGLGAGDLNGGFSAVIENQMCHDGMSDRENALRIRLFIHENGETYGLDGCCGLSP